MSRLANWLTQQWYQRHPIRWLFTPLSASYRIIIWLRRQAYHFGYFKQHQLSVPVIIVGNLTVGGTGKTPFVIWLAQQLIEAGYTPGIISRGYGGKTFDTPQLVTASSNPSELGDEPVLLAQRTACPVVIFPQRVVAGEMLLDTTSCDIIIADDGLQHTALKRDLEIVIVDGVRQFGNQHCLPVGPLREPLSRLKSINFLVLNGGNHPHAHHMQLHADALINLADPTRRQKLSDFAGQTIHAIAGIGHPERFFQQLREHKIIVNVHPFPDHYPYQQSDFKLLDNHPIIMTEKDAVKCQSFASNNMWFLPVTAQLDADFSNQLMRQIKSFNKKESPNG